MKKIELFIAKIIVKLFFVLTYLLPIQKNRISIISYFNEEYDIEFSKIVDELTREGFEIKSCLKQFEYTKLGKLRYLFSFIKQAYLFNTSSIILLDGNSFVYSNVNIKKDIKVVQLWHATGAIKKFGNLANRLYDIKEYSNVLVASEYFRPIFAQALNTNIDNVLALGVSKTDYLFNQSYQEEQIQKFYQNYPELINKKIILYAPTFRGAGVDDMSFNHNSQIEKLSSFLDEKYEIIVKRHPLISENIFFDKAIEVINEDIYQLLLVSNYIISDYSSLIFDGIVLNRKIILYLYDLEDYVKHRGLCLDVDALPVKKGYSIQEVAQIINDDFEIEAYSDFINQYLSAIDGNSTKRIVEYLKILNERWDKLV